MSDFRPVQKTYPHCVQLLSEWNYSCLNPNIPQGETVRKGGHNTMQSRSNQKNSKDGRFQKSSFRGEGKRNDIKANAVWGSSASAGMSCK